MDKNINLNYIGDILKKDLELILKDVGGLGRLDYLAPPKKIQDSTTSILIKNKENKKTAVLLCARSEYSKNVERNVNNAQKAKRLIPGSAILDPLFYKEIEGIICAVWPYCEPLSENRIIWPIQRLKIRKSILKWLREVTEKGLQKISLDEQKKGFLIPLENFASNKKIDKELREEVKYTIDDLQNNIWIPKFVLAHNDLRKCNIMQGVTKYDNFTVIDWAGANFNGYAIYDLICIASDLNLPAKDFIRELEVHCKILECGINDAKSYLFASLAYLGMNLEYFPEERYLMLVNYSQNYLFSRLSHYNATVKTTSYCKK